MTAAVFDLKNTLKVTKQLLKKNDPTRRVSVIEGDFNRQKIPKGFDVAFLSNIIHAEDKAGNQRLIKKIHTAISPGGLIIIKDHILNEALTHPAGGSLFALTMLLFTRGRCYSKNAVKTWLQRAGFKKIRRIKTPASMTSDLIVGQKSAVGI